MSNEHIKELEPCRWCALEIIAAISFPSVQPVEEQEFGDSFVAAVKAINGISEDRRLAALAMLNNYFAAATADNDKCEHGISLDHDCLHCENQQDEINVGADSVGEEGK